MYKCERENEILELLSENDYVTVEYLSKRMRISASSIRRDLKNLEERGLVNRSYGGVKLADATGKRIPYSLRTHENSTQKKQMAKATLALIAPGDVVFLDGSSSAYFLAELLPSVSGVTVITNSIDIMSYLTRYNVKAFCTGGQLSAENRGVLVGGYTEGFLKNIQADVAVFSVQAVGRDGRFFDCYPEEVAIRSIMIANARRCILLCDSSKWNKGSTFYQASVDDVDYIVSDKDLNKLFDDPQPQKYILA